TSKFGITVWGKDDSKSTINNFNNSGTIHSNAGESIYLSNVDIKTFSNGGTIQSNNGKGVNISSGVSIENFTNSGTIQGNWHGVSISSGVSIQSFNNNSGGIIQSNSSSDQAIIFEKDSSTSTFKNQGTLIGGSGAASVQVGTNNQNGVTIETFTNEGIIGNGSSKFGVIVYGSNSSKSTINNFSNSGTIHSNAGEAIYLDNVNIQTFSNSGTITSNSSKGVNIASGASIQNFTNSGTILSKGENGINIGSVIEKFENNGVINGKGSGIFVTSGVKTLINSGAIIGESGGATNGGIKLESGNTIENIINTGTISSNTAGITVSYGKFGTLTIKDGGMVYGRDAGIKIGQWQTLGDLYIDGKNSEKDGTVSGIYGDNYGITLDIGSRTQKIELKNGGVIKGGISGIRLDKEASLSGE
ncbi:hypothetical protein N7H64_001864, partial [Campylobacter jejuni]|nr:hypothetical protein [Campylobacter jejuni]